MPLNIHQEIESILAEIVPLAQLKEITILNKTDPNLAVKADTHLLSVIFRNLLSNAIKFTHREGLILLESEKYKNLVNRSEEHTSELQSRGQIVCRLLLDKK